MASRHDSTQLARWEGATMQQFHIIARTDDGVHEYYLPATDLLAACNQADSYVRSHNAGAVITDLHARMVNGAGNVSE